MVPAPPAGAPKPFALAHQPKISTRFDSIRWVVSVMDVRPSGSRGGTGRLRLSCAKSAEL